MYSPEPYGYLIKLVKYSHSFKQYWILGKLEAPSQNLWTQDIKGSQHLIFFVLNQSFSCYSREKGGLPGATSSFQSPCKLKYFSLCVIYICHFMQLLHSPLMCALNPLWFKRKSNKRLLAAYSMLCVKVVYYHLLIFLSYYIYSSAALITHFL